MKVMIIGGTSGIGLALGRHYVSEGAKVALCGRNPDRLAGHQLQSNERVYIYKADIRERVMLSHAMEQFSKEEPAGLDIVIVTAGQYVSAEQEKDSSLVDALLATNIQGVSNAFELAVEFGSGQLVVVASIAGLLPDYPGISIYAASKRATIAISDAYRIGLSRRGITVTTLVPGYVDTLRLRELNAGCAEHKPFLLSEEKAVELMVAAIKRKVPIHIFPWQLHLMVKIFCLLPKWLQRFRSR